MLWEEVAKRKTSRNVVAEMATAHRPARDKRRPGVTMTVSFTIDPATDQALHALAIQENCSRSAIVRAAVQRYAYDDVAKALDAIK